MAIVVFSRGQQALTDGIPRIEIEATRVDGLIEALCTRFPKLTGLLEQVAVSIDGEVHNDASYLAVSRDSEVHFVGPIAGGSA